MYEVVCSPKNAGSGSTPEFSYWFGPTRKMCPLAPMSDRLFHYGGKNQNYSEILSLPAYSDGGVLM